MAKFYYKLWNKKTRRYMQACSGSYLAHSLAEVRPFQGFEWVVHKFKPVGKKLVRVKEKRYA